MDSVVPAALEEICCEGPNGLLLLNLWSKLSPALASSGLPLCPNVKRAVWESLLEIPGLRLEAGEGGCISKENLIKCTVEEGEQLNVKFVAPEAMRKSFVGTYEIEASDSKLSNTQRIILERLAVARANGIAQNELSKGLRIPSKNLFYQLKRLEIYGLIVRHPTVIRMKQASNNGEPKLDSVATTNMLHLYRYGKQLGSQQRLEITKEDKLLMDREVGDGDNLFEDVTNEDVHVKDFLPAIKDICDKLENAEGKVLVVSDLKRDLNYRRASGHRSWRNICHRLKDAQVVEECCTLLNGKKVICLRLLRSFSPSLFGPKSHGCGSSEIDVNQMGNLVKRGEITEQLLELPILHQIYDMINAAGSKGLTNTEVCRRLGLCSKEYHKRYFKQMVSRFGLHLRLETQNRVEVYRVWTAENFNPEPYDVLPTGRETITQELIKSDSHTLECDFPDKLPRPLQIVDNTSSSGNVESVTNSENGAAVLSEASFGTDVDYVISHNMALKCCNPENFDAGIGNEVPIGKLLPVCESPADNTLAETHPATGVINPWRRSYPRYPRLTMGSTSREQRILAMLQEEKFLLKPELHRRLEHLDKEKNTTMDRKTLERSLNKLQQEGHCKCVHVSVPGVTNCGRSRSTEVVLHPSVFNVSRELLDQIHDRMRSFEIQIRRQPYSGLKKGRSLPVLDNVQRIPSSVTLDGQSEHGVVMRANGFVFAKMVRTKLLHIFLWDWVCSSSCWNDASSSRSHACDSKNPHSFCKLFELDVAIKSMPLELFLQVVGSTQKIENMVEKCRSGLLLSDLPIPEYRILVDTRATGRLSWLIYILRRLKLIRLVSKGHAEDGSNRHMSLTHALELKPYVEEPVSTVGSSGFVLPDLRPRVRHDFVLSSREAVDEYWNTLEYCYAAAKSTAALLAFPGSAVHEVFHSRSWASVRVMTASQRAELLKTMENYDAQKKLSFRECEKIAKDLDLTLEQVLRVHYDKRQQGKHVSSSRKRKRLSSKVSSNVAKDSGEDGRPSVKASNQVSEQKHSLSITSEDADCQLPREFTGNITKRSEEPELNEDEDASILRSKCAVSRLGSARQKKFQWTEEADRQLVMEYVRHVAALGAKSRVNWASVLNLPAPPSTCKRRMGQLKGFIPFRKAVMKLCDMLAERYAKYLEKFQGEKLNHVEFGKMVRDYASEQIDVCSSGSSSWKWDDFDENNIKVALDDILRYKRMARLHTVKDNFSDQESNEEEEVEGSGGSRAPGRRSNSRQLPRKYTKILSKVEMVKRHVHESVAIANAVELFKLIFLSTSTAPEVPPLLAETLRRYSEHDLVAAFNYLREKKIMIGGSCNSPFVLSQHFQQIIDEPEFPRGTGERATKFFIWCNEKEKYLVEEGVEVPSDWQCGEVISMLPLVASGEFSITPSLPNEGVGEAEDYLNSRYQCDDREFDSGEVFKILKTAGEEGRREKGFPGIKVLLHRQTIPITSVVDGDTCRPSKIGGKDPVAGSDIPYASSSSGAADHVREILDSGGINTQLAVNDSPWEAMASYAKYLMSFCSYQGKCSFLIPGLFKTLYSAIQKSGDQGLSLKEIEKVVNIEDEQILDIMVEVLETFGRASKVNAYNSIHVVDSLYRSKYFLTSLRDHPVTHLNGQKRKLEDDNRLLNLDNSIDSAVSEYELNVNADDVHRVTILNLPEDIPDNLGTTICNDKTGDYQHSEVVPHIMKGRLENFELHSADSQIYSPLLPWMNGDGTINENVYKGLIRRVLGIVMKNPGIMEDNIIKKMDCLNPQSCRKLLEIMIMDNHIFTRKMQQKVSTQPPSILGSLLVSHARKSKLICRVHLFSNPMSTTLL